MDDKQRREERQKLKELRRELEDKIKGIIPEALKAKTPFEVVDEKIEESLELDDKSAKQIIEAVLFASSRTLSSKEISKIVKPITAAQVTKLVRELKAEYIATERSYRINEIAGGFEISTLPQFGMWIARLEKAKKAKQASLAALETLAILAYKQPVTRVEIEEIRGVDASGVIATLMDRGFIKIVGRKDVPGRPLLYGTTELFLEHFGLKSIKDLPNIDEIKTLVEDTIKKEELLRKENLVPNVQENLHEQVPTEQDKESIAAEKKSLAERYDEISAFIEGVKVKSEKQISEIIKPNAEEASQDTVVDVVHENEGGKSKATDETAAETPQATQ